MTVNGVTTNFAYAYDPMGRLLTVTKDGTLVEEYRYGANGARSYEMNALKGIAGRNYTYTDEDQVITAGDLTYRYDVDGFLAIKTVSGTTTTYEYATRGELMKVTLPNGNVIEYINDPLGRRIAKKINGAITEKYLWQGLTRLLAVYDGADNLLERFIYADSRLPVAMQSGGNTFYLTYDQVGSLISAADSAGNAIKSITYDSFGNIIQDSAPTVWIPIGFAGGLFDVDTGLIRFGFREYSPEIGRWTAKDPILFLGGDVDLYGYCVNDPVNGIDSWGLFVYGSYDQNTGNLYLYDPTTGLEVSAEFFSGGLLGDPIPNGTYDILGHGGRSDFYRLEPVDAPYGDDISQRTGRTNFRLHKPGRSTGCLTAKTWDDWNKIKKFLDATKAYSATVPSKYMNPIKKLRNPTEILPWYGRLTVTGSN